MVDGFVNWSIPDGPGPPESPGQQLFEGHSNELKSYEQVRKKKTDNVKEKKLQKSTQFFTLSLSVCVCVEGGGQLGVGEWTHHLQPPAPAPHTQHSFCAGFNNITAPTKGGGQGGGGGGTKTWCHGSGIVSEDGSSEVKTVGHLD